MIKIVRIALLASILCMASSAVAAAPISETRSVDARVTKIRLGGAITLQVKQGPVASLVLTGDRALIDTVTARQSGELLSIDRKKMSYSWNSHDAHDLRAVLTVPTLSQLTTTGVGTATLTGFKGDSITLIHTGAGSLNLDGHYKIVKARLGGVGSMSLTAAASDEVDLTLRGAGKISVTGKARLLKANLAGVGSLEAKDLLAEAVDLDMNGLGGAEVYAQRSANVNLNGMGSATVYGRPPQRTSSDRGIGRVHWR